MKNLIKSSENNLLPLGHVKSWLILLLAGMAFLMTLNGCSSTQSEDNKVIGDLKQSSEVLKVVVFGGTVTEGKSAKLDVFYDCFKWGTTTVNKVRETQTWWSILERILTDWVASEVEIISSGVAGNTAANGLVRLEDDVLSQAPDYVLVMFGMDDALAGVRVDNFKKDLKIIVDRIEEENANVVLLTPPPVSERMTINCTMDELRQRQIHLSSLVQVIRDLAKEKSIPLIDFYQYFLDNHLAYGHLFEGWIPDAVAQTAMAPFVAGELLPLMGVNNYPNPTLGDYRKAYSDSKNPQAKHNGFTDLTYFKGEFYLAFRSGAIHGVKRLLEAKTLMLRSSDGITWTKDAELKVESFLETRDPKFLYVEDHLYVYASCHNAPESGYKSEHYGFEMIGSGKWSEPFKCAPTVLWRPKKWEDKYVVAGFERKVDEQQMTHYRAVLYQSKDAREWKKVSTIIDYEKDANETELFVEKDKLMAYARCEGRNKHEMMISTYIPEENRWESVNTGRLIQAPCVFKVGDRTMITGRYCSQSDDGFRDLRKDWNAFTRGSDDEMDNVDPARVEAYHHGLRTGIFVIEGTKPRLVMELLSAGDSSYPGVVEYGDEYVISDYSMHEYYPEIKRPGDWETPSDIYISRIRFEQTEI